MSRRIDYDEHLAAAMEDVKVTIVAQSLSGHQDGDCLAMAKVRALLALAAAVQGCREALERMIGPVEEIADRLSGRSPS